MKFSIYSLNILFYHIIINVFILNVDAYKSLLFLLSIRKKDMYI